MLANHGLQVSVQEDTTADPDQDGRVIDQAPIGGTRVHEGDTVSIVVGVYGRGPDHAMTISADVEERMRCG